MKIVINASTVRIGGGLQAAHSFINECRALSDYTFHVFLSKKVGEIIDPSLFPGNFFFHHTVSGSATARSRRMLREELAELEHNIQPDVVFTIFGPPYWRPGALHICGFAKGQYIYKDSPLYRILPLKQLLMLRLKEYLHVKSFKKDCDMFVVETDDVRDRLKKLIPGKPVYTVTNTCHQLFDDRNQWAYNIALPATDAFSLLTIAANYVHKNLGIIPRVIEYLLDKYPGFKFRFILTIEREQLQGITARHAPYLVFLGTVDMQACPHLYQQADAMFLPTLVECFSVSYVEAMKMDRVILTSDLSFAKGICRDAALYFDPLSPQNIGDAIYQAAQSDALRAELVQNGRKQLPRFLSARERAAQYLSIIKECHEAAYSIV